MSTKMKKVLAGIALGVVGVTSITGCKANEEQQRALDLAVSKTEEIANVVTAMSKEVTREEALDEFKDRFYNFMTSVVNKNLTFVNKYDNTVRGARIEYVSDELTRVHIYKERNNIREEVYREITKDTVTTWVNLTGSGEGAKMYSVVPRHKAETDFSLLWFDGDNDVALKNDNETITWNRVFEQYLAVDDMYSLYFGTSLDPIEWIMSVYNDVVVPITTSMLESMNAVVSLENDVVTLNHREVSYDQRDHHDADSYGYMESALSVTNLSFVEKSTEVTNVPGKGIDRSFDDFSLTLDEENQNTLNFDKTGYTLVSDFYAEQ